MKKINLDLKYLIAIWILLIIAIISTYAHHGHLILDCGREVYYPTQVLLGKVLYKDIFNMDLNLKEFINDLKLKEQLNHLKESKRLNELKNLAGYYLITGTGKEIK